MTFWRAGNPALTSDHHQSTPTSIFVNQSFRLRLSSALAAALERALRQGRYGPHQKGLWVGEALERLRRGDPALKKVGVGDALDAPRDRSMALTLRQDHSELLTYLMLRVRESALLLEGVRALVVRSAIRARIRAEGQRNGLADRPH